MALIRAVWRYWMTAAIAVILIGTFARLGYVIADGWTREPYVVDKVDVLTPQIRLGEPIKVRFSVERRKLCTTTIAEFWIDRDTGQPLYRNRVPGGYAPLGKRQTLVSIAVPIALPPGRYAYRSIMESDCGLTTFAAFVPDAEFDVIP